MSQPFTITGAVLSPCETFRYRLWRYWGGGEALMFCMLNPSKADASIDDPTIRKCMGFARRLGYGGIEVVNLYAYRATDPGDLKRAGCPVGPENDAHIRAVASGVNVTKAIVGWGSEATGHGRVSNVFELLHQHVEVFALRTNKDGSPGHPLYIPYSCKAEWWRPQGSLL